jgi:hypothetical protein
MGAAAQDDSTARAKYQPAGLPHPEYHLECSQFSRTATNLYDFFIPMAHFFMPF